MTIKIFNTQTGAVTISEEPDNDTPDFISVPSDNERLDQVEAALIELAELITGGA